MTDPDPSVAVPLAQLPASEKAKRAASFGGAASLYERFRPGPPAAAIDWMLPARVSTVVDLGAGTGALTRLLLDRAGEVVAVEPDDRMRAVLQARSPGTRAVAGRGESMPLPDGSADAVLASSSWHWMDPIPALNEVARVLVPGGTLGAVWSGPDDEGPFISQARAVLAAQSSDEAGGSELAGAVMADADRPSSTLVIPPGTAFDQPEQHVFKWDVALNADELIGLLGTFSWIITMPDEKREQLLATARRLLRDVMGVDGDVTVDVGFRADTWRTHRNR